MFTAHAAVAVLIKSRVPKASATWLLVGVFVADLIWIAFAAVGIEPTAPASFFDDWSHSLASVLLWATLFAGFFRREGRAVAAAMWIAVASHFLLDFPIHPQALALYPHSTIRLSLGVGHVAPMLYWQIQLVLVVLLAACYAFSVRRLAIAPSRVAGTIAGLLALHVVLMPGA
jgi:hypothetical protein